MLAWHQERRASFPDLRYKVVDLIVGGDRAAVHWRAAGTQTGQFGPVPPTGTMVSYSGATFLRFDPEGLIADMWSINELFQLLQQLGVEMLPPPDSNQGRQRQPWRPYARNAWLNAGIDTRLGASVPNPSLRRPHSGPPDRPWLIPEPISLAPVPATPDAEPTANPAGVALARVYALFPAAIRLSCGLAVAAVALAVREPPVQAVPLALAVVVLTIWSYVFYRQTVDNGIRPGSC